MTVRPSLAGLLDEFRMCFSAWTFPVFCALACGLVAQSARRTVRGMLVGARLSQFHDGSATGERKVGYANNWVIAAIVERLPFLDRPVALPVGFALIRKGSDEASRLEAARRLVEELIAALPGRRIDAVADSAYAGKALRGLPAAVTGTSRLRSNAALYELAPPRTGRRGRRKTKGASCPP